MMEGLGLFYVNVCCVYAVPVCWESGIWGGGPNRYNA